MFRLCFEIAFLNLIIAKQVTGSLQYGKTRQASFINFNVLKGFRLFSNLSQAFDVSDSTKCAFQCLKLWNSCFSFNFGPGTMCETSSTDYYRNKTALIEAKGVIHFYIPNPCSSFPCQNNGTCQPKYSLDSYVCQCLIRFSGIFCEIGPLGMEDGRISDEQISVSSYYVFRGTKYDGSRARLNLLEWPQGWHAKNANPWIKVDLLVVRKVCVVATQGWGGPSVGGGYVINYQLTSFFNNVEWVTYEEDGVEKVFDGNYDPVTAVKNVLKNPPQARFVKILPTAWRKSCRMRMELYGWWVREDWCVQQRGKVVLGRRREYVRSISLSMDEP